MNEYRNVHVQEQDKDKTFGELMQEGRLKWIAGHANMVPEQGVKFMLKVECVGYDEEKDQYLIQYTPVESAPEEDCVQTQIDDRGIGLS